MRCYTNVSKTLRRVSLVQRTRKQARCLLQLLLLSVYFIVKNTMKAQGLKVLREGKGSGVALTRNSKGTQLATFADPFNSTIYIHSSIAMRAATTKIPHLLYEKDLLKTPKVMYDFIYSLWFIYNEYIWWEWEKNPEICTNENQGKKFPVWLPSHPPVYENGGRLFSGVRKHRKQAGPTLAAAALRSTSLVLD